MKTLKIINHIFWAIAAVVLNILVVYYWGNMACRVESLIIGCLIYTLLCIGGWAIFNNHYKEIEDGK